MEQDGHGGLAVGPHAVFGLDNTGICTHSTGPALTHLGLRPGELVGTNLFDLYREDPINVTALRRVLEGETFSLEREFQGRLLSTYFEPVRDLDGSVTGALGVTTDITEQQRLEGLLPATRERAGRLADVSAALSRDLLDPDTLPAHHGPLRNGDARRRRSRLGAWDRRPEPRARGGLAVRRRSR